MKAIGIDLGGTNFRLAVFDFDNSDKPTEELRAPVGDDRSPEHIVEFLGKTIEDVGTRHAGKRAHIAVGIGFAGMFHGLQGHVANSPQFGWRNVAFGAMLSERLGKRFKLVIDNDVNAITYGEWKAGAARGASDVLAVFGGTGVGGGIIAGATLMRGGGGCAAEIGHVKVVHTADARRCHCGKRGCVEAYVGGRYLQHRVRQELCGGARSLAVKLAGGPGAVHPGHLDEAAANGDDYALSIYGEVAPLLGIALANAVTLLNSSHLVIGGGMFSRTPILLDHALAAMQVAINEPANRSLKIVNAELGDHGGLVGSALLALDHAR